MTKTQARRDRGLCIWCEAPALPDTTRNVAANRALSEGRMVPSAATAKLDMRGMPYARLSTLAWCEPCGAKHSESIRVSKLCTRCGQRPRAAFKARLCLVCRDKRRTQKRGVDDQKARAGICTRCGQPSMARTCEACRVNARERRARLVEHRKSSGMCTRCGKSGVYRTCCDDCLEGDRHRKGEERTA